MSFLSNVLDSHFKHQIVTTMRSIQQQISKLTKTVGNLVLPLSSVYIQFRINSNLFFIWSSFYQKHDSLAAFRQENDSENFPSEVVSVKYDDTIISCFS